MKRALAALLFFATPLHADAWARGRGAAYVYFGLATSSATEAYDATGERVPFPGRGSRHRRASLYAETGLTDALTLVVNAPYERVTSRGLFNDFTTSGGGDLDLRLRLSRRVGTGAVAIEGGAFIPLGYDDRAFPQLGTGAVEPVVSLAYGTGIAALPEGFASVQLGYRKRGGGVSDEIPYSAKLGAFLHPRVGTFVSVRGWESRGEFRDIDPTYALVAADSERLSAGAELYARLTRFLDANVTWTRPLRGRNTGIGNEWGVGIAIRR